MQITTSLSPHDPLPSLSVDVAIVIDVLRATTVMTTAMASGANQITTVAEISEAFAIAQNAQTRPLLCGERHCKPIDGFDFGNSPSDYVRSTVGDRNLVLTTTNGTQAIVRNESARQMLAVSFLNLSATAMEVAHANTVHLVCAGTNGSISGEDVLLAGAVVEKLMSKQPSAQACDSSRIAQAFWNNNPKRMPLEDRLRESLGARNLIRLGMTSDIGLCAAVDQASVIVRRVRRVPATFVGEMIR
ncbi:putative 2-phosphosulfolactate phosphatase [Rubripirellula obstinata]|uniref:Probable 2-phosphosulfolactate phosphatase n=1 Tax=Rubripirellula obstinata TaxID=406547 RepID=A0A5B1CI79_9BACT|nr:2-phosphosulfolactate phosphatase [Rubripirellula obstinata]KAA1260266.1 putative 2-phosphosulfolactate phosphatase [Rubripirellula obstinata]